MRDTTIELSRALFGERENPLLQSGELTARVFRYGTGIEAIRLGNARGSVVVLPFYGQMVWDAAFDGVDITMAGMFDQPRRGATILDTYACFAYHSGIVRNGCPSAEDDHTLHGEFSCAELDRAALQVGTDAEGDFLRLVGEREYAVSFGARYRATPTVTLRPGATLFDIGLLVENLGGRPMDLMYMCHVNFAFAAGARIVQPTAFSPESMVVRATVPAHVPVTPDYAALLADLARDPARMERLDEPDRYNPELVSYVRDLRTGPDGLTHLMLHRQQGDGFAISYDTRQFPKTVRWVLHNADMRVAAFALPSTCEPEGYLAERGKGHVRSLAQGARTQFSVRAGYLDRDAAGRRAALIAAL